MNKTIKQSVMRGVMVSMMLMTVISLMFLIGIYLYNFGRGFELMEVSLINYILAGIFSLGSLGIVGYVIYRSFYPFFKQVEGDRIQYSNILYIALFYRIFFYLLFMFVNPSVTAGFTGSINNLHTAFFVLNYHTELMPILFFTDPLAQFLHSILLTDIVSIGLVLLGFRFMDNRKYMPVYGSIIGLLISLAIITYITIYSSNNIHNFMLYYKLDTVFASLIMEFSMIGFTVHYVFFKK